MADAPGAATRLYPRLLHSIRVAMLLVTSAVLGLLCVRQLRGDLHRSDPWWLEVAAFGVLVAILVVVAVELLVPGIRRSGWRDFALAEICLAVGVIVSVVSPPERLFSPDDWAFGLIGWFGLMLLFDRPARTIVAFLAAHLVLSVGAAVVLGAPQPVAIVIAAVPAFGFQLAVGLITQLMKNMVAAADDAAEQEERLRTEEALAEHAHHDHRTRLRARHAGAVPLLTGLADGTLDPGSATVRHRCAMEAARLRRLFAEHDDHHDPLAHELRAVIDVTERRGIPVTLLVRGAPTDIPPTPRRELVDATCAALLGVRTAGRVTVLRTPTTVRVGVVGDPTDDDPPAGEPPTEIDITTSVEDTETWMEARWNRTPSP